MCSSLFAETLLLAPVVGLLTPPLFYFPHQSCQLRFPVGVLVVVVVEMFWRVELPVVFLSQLVCIGLIPQFV